MKPGGPMGGGRPPMGGGRPPMGRGKTPLEKAEDFYEENFDMAQMEKECEEMLDIHSLNKDNCSFDETDGGFISLKYNEKKYDNINIIRTFPFTEPNCYLSVRESSGKKKEIGIINNLIKDFDEKTVTIISKQLNIRYFMPVIEHITSIKEENRFVIFKVKTNHGNMEFSIQSNGNHFSYLSDTRILITDLEGNRYEIPDIEKLSPKDLKKLDVYL